VISFIIGAALTALALVFVLLPLVTRSRSPLARVRSGFDAQNSPAANLGDSEASAIDVLREVEFDRATGKLSESDYATLKAALTTQALGEMRAKRQGAASVGGASGVKDAVMANASLACPVCGPRPEADADYCSSCGTYLTGKCGECGASVTQPAARFCTECGASL
jgi:hypothetical protein